MAATVASKPACAAVTETVVSAAGSALSRGSQKNQRPRSPSASTTSTSDAGSLASATESGTSTVTELRAGTDAAIVAATAARLGIVIVVAARAAGATRRAFVGVNIVITSVSGIVRIHSGGQYRFLEEQGRHRLAATHGLVARGQGFDRVEQALIRGVLVRIRNCTARTTANRTVLVIIIHIHRRTARAGANRPILVVIIVGLAGARAAANRAVLVVIVIVHNRTAAGTWGVIVIEIIGTDSAARTTRTIILAIRVGHCGSGAARTAAGWTFGGILGIAGFIGIAGIG